MADVKALELQVGDTRESVYGTPMKVWSIQKLDGGVLVKWDLGAEMDYLFVDAFYSEERNPVLQLLNR